MEFQNCYLKDVGYEKFEKVVNMIGGKWKLRIIYVLAFHEILRYGELKRLLSPITHKMLATQLKELEKDGLVNRKAYEQIPPKVEYSLTQMGRELKPVVKEMYHWIERYDIQGEHQPYAAMTEEQMLSKLKNPDNMVRTPDMNTH